MSYEIKQSISYEIKFQFSKTEALIDVEIFEENVLYINSRTDGYHWLQYWLSHEPDAEKLHDLTYEDTCWKNKQLFSKYGMIFDPEDKETAFITLPTKFNPEYLDIIANIIEPRFAIRERFFD